MTGGDRFDIDIEVGAGARLTVTTAAAEKIYRSLGPDTDDRRQTRRRSPAAHWRGCRRKRSSSIRRGCGARIDIDLARDAKLLLARSRRVRPFRHGRDRGPRSIFRPLARARRRPTGLCRDTALDGDIAQRLAQRAVAAGGVAVASVLKYPGNDDDAAAVRAMQDDFAGEVGVSAWNGLVVVRLVATRWRRAAPRSALPCSTAL